MLTLLSLYFYFQPQRTIADLLRIKENKKKRDFSKFKNTETLSGLRYFKNASEKAFVYGISISPGRIGFITLATTSTFVILSLVLFQSIFFPTLIGCFVFVITPKILLFYLYGKLHKSINEQLPKILFTISGALKSGSTLIDAIGLSGKETGSPLGPELNTIYESIKYGGESIDRAFSKSLKRLGNHHMIKRIYMAIQITRITGGNVSLTLDGVSKMVNDEIYTESLSRSYSTQGKIAALAFNIVPVFAVITTEMTTPGTFEQYFYSSTQGQFMLFISVFLVLLGWIAIFYILKRTFDI